MLAVMFALEQAEGFLCGQLGDASEILDAKTIQNLSACEFARTRAKWAFDYFRSAMKTA